MLRWEEAVLEDGSAVVFSPSGEGLATLPDEIHLRHRAANVPDQADRRIILPSTTQLTPPPPRVRRLFVYHALDIRRCPVIIARCIRIGAPDHSTPSWNDNQCSASQEAPEKSGNQCQLWVQNVAKVRAALCLCHILHRGVVASASAVLQNEMDPSAGLPFTVAVRHAPPGWPLFSADQIAYFWQEAKQNQILVHVPRAGRGAGASVRRRRVAAAVRAGPCEAAGAGPGAAPARRPPGELRAFAPCSRDHTC